jgi:hypothetical protein
MGGAIKSFAKGVAKAAISGAGSAIPLIGGPLASWINSKFARGSFDIGNPGVAIPDGAKTKAINTPAQLKALVKANPEEAQKAGITVQMIDEQVKEAKEQSKAIGGAVKMPINPYVKRVGIPETTVMKNPKMAVGGVPKAKKPRTKAQMEATKRLVEANRLRRAKK